MAVKKAVTAKKIPTTLSQRASTGNLGFMNLLTKKVAKLNKNSKETRWKVGENLEYIWAYVRGIAGANAKTKAIMRLAQSVI